MKTNPRRLHRSVQLVALAALLLVGCGAQQTCTVGNPLYAIDSSGEIGDIEGYMIKVDDRPEGFQFMFGDLPTDHDFTPPYRESLRSGDKVICRETDEGVGWEIVGPAD